MAKPVKRTVAAMNLEAQHAAMALQFRWLGSERTLTKAQKEEAAAVFNTSERKLRASKKLYNTQAAEFKALTALKGRIEKYFDRHSLPYTEDGIRLFPRKNVAAVVEKLTAFRAQLHELVNKLQEVYDDIIEEARNELGDLFNPSDYPATMVGAFDFEWRFVNVSPPDYLMQLSPAVYEAEKAKMQAKLEEAVRLAEQGFATELAKLVEHLSNKLSSVDEEGNRAIFKSSTVDNLTEFFARFKSLNLKSNAQLDKLVADAQALLGGVDSKSLRHNYVLRDQLAEQMGGIKEQLDGLITVQPRRKLNRAAIPAAPANGAV